MSIKTLVAATGLILSLSTSMAQAGPGHWHHGWHHGPHWSVGVYYAPWPAYVGPVYVTPGYTRYVEVAPATTTVYVEPQTSYVTPPPPQRTAPDWYYCSDPDGYYPYVRQCRLPWQRVPASPR